MDEEAAQTQYYEDTYRALGLFVIRFSELLDSLQEATVECMTDGVMQRMLGYAALADRTAEPIQRSFFAVYFERWSGALTKDDEAILAQMRKEIRDLIEIRNRLMHDAWMRYAKVGAQGPKPRPLWRLRYKAHGSGLDIEDSAHTPDELVELGERARRLAQLVISTSFSVPEGGPALNQRMEVVMVGKAKEVRFKKFTPPPRNDELPA
jgi:hypothetical protein